MSLAKLIVIAASFTALWFDRFTPVYINNSIIRCILYLIVSSLSITLVTQWLFAAKARRYRWAAILLAGILITVKAYFTWGADWKTQTIIYESRNNRSQAIEFQMRGDRFAFGYKKRVVKREKLMPFVDYITDVDTIALNGSDWHRIDKNINQLNLADFEGKPAK